MSISKTALAACAIFLSVAAHASELGPKVAARGEWAAPAARALCIFWKHDYDLACSVSVEHKAILVSWPKLVGFAPDYEVETGICDYTDIRIPGWSVVIINIVDGIPYELTRCSL